MFEAASGAATEVPLTFEVVPETDAEGAAEPPAEASLAMYPNPTAGRATVTVLLAKRTDLRVEVFDVLGRRVTVLHDAATEAGQHRFGLATAGLPSGVYLVRMSAADGTAQAQRVTLLR